MSLLHPAPNGTWRTHAWLRWLTALTLLTLLMVLGWRFGVVVEAGELLQDHPYAAGFAVFLVEEAGLPLPMPGDLLMMSAAAFEQELRIQPAAFVSLAVLASMIGSSFLYVLSCRLRMDQWLDRHGHWVHLSGARLHRWRVEARHDALRAVLVGRLVPGLRIAVSLGARGIGVGYLPFIAAVAISATVWWSGIYLIGRLFGQDALRALRGIPGWLWPLLLAAIVLGLVVRARRAHRPTEEETHAE